MARQKKKKGYPAPYKSGLEHRLHTGAMKHALYEPDWGKTQYTIIKNYVPDFIHEDEPFILYEAKGRFRTFDEAKKYIHVRDSNPEVTIRFIITNPNSRAYPQTEMTMGDWLTKHGFEWCTETEVPPEWTKPKNSTTKKSD